MDIQHLTLSGIDAIFVTLPESTSTTIEIMVKAGSIYETRETNGLSHFLEHMFFKGGKKYPTPKAVAETIDAFGGEFNAYTSEEYAGYYVKCAPEFVHQAADVLADMLVHAQFPKEELEREKGVIIQEIMMYEDMPHVQVAEYRKRRYYGDNSFGRPVLGPVENIQQFTQEDFFAHKQHLYTKDNLVVIIAGAIMEPTLLQEHISKLFQDLPSTKNSTTPVLIHQLPPEHHNSLTKKTQQNHLIISAPWYSMHQEERFAAKMLAILLGGTMSSRLFQEIREKKWLCYYISASHSADDQDGTFLIRSGMEKQRRAEGLKAIYEQLAYIAAGDITPGELMMALGNLTGKTKVGLETSDEVAQFVGKQRLFKKQIKRMDEILAYYHEVTLEDLKRVAQKLTTDQLYTYRVE